MKKWDDVKRDISSIPDYEKEVLEITAYLVSKLIDRRHELGLTQIDVANRSGLHQSAIARMESAKIIPKVDTLQIVAKSLGLSLELVSNEEAVTI